MRPLDLDPIPDDAIIESQVTVIDDPSQSFRMTMGQLVWFVRKVLQMGDIITHNDSEYVNTVNGGAPDAEGNATVKTNTLLGNVESIPNGDNMRDYFTYHPTAVYRSAGTDVLGGPPNWQYGPLHFKLHGIRASDGLAEFGAVTAWNADGIQWQCNLVNGGWGEWREVFDSINKPTPGEIGACHADMVTSVGIVSNDENSPYMRAEVSQNIIHLARKDQAVSLIRAAMYINTAGDLRDAGARFMTGIYATNGYDNPTNHESRQLQYAISGNWFDVPAA